jgi:hypothetical protein
MATGEPVKEALDHLLDPLDVSPPSQPIAPDEDSEYAPTPAAARSGPRGWRDVVAAYLVRMRRSKRLLYKIPRLVVAWTALIVGVCGLIWITFGAVGLR